PDGTPTLNLVDIAKADRCMAERRCQTCGLDIRPGERLGFIGSPGDAEFKEAPIHVECATYSFQVCPHLLAGTRDAAVIIVVCHEYEYRPRTAAQAAAGIPSVCRPSPSVHGPVTRYTPVELVGLLPG
ncbi:MAG: hypothetical protein ACRD0P_37690, partial [Stackebrandtia sp.]